ncbi:MAG: hypothetical protein UR93_C0030G0003 [Berkelbacteria bacterium GW2011_GWA2_35_9]|uniref:Integral membrane protein n=1 Tax=Berkelbacteria bacterium GW2011_GWA2_35_9 TaxID=1618333 RepID=A0A0G0FK35_9BACT|nr:MAG: hypothetical protein UR93_C0030G0003 [Berkelbacteria bacterium GW2011_GWA2_35_9]
MVYKITNYLIDFASAANPIDDINGINPSNTKLKESFAVNEITPTNLASLIYKTVLSIAGVVFLLMLLFGAFSYLLGAGNEEKTGKAKKLMVDAVIGVALTASAYGIGQFVLNLLST